MATTNAGAFTVTRLGIVINPDGSMVLGVQYNNAGSGTPVVDRALLIPADTSKAIVDQFGNIIASQVPAALATAITTFLAQIDASIASGASGNKLNL